MDEELENLLDDLEKGITYDEIKESYQLNRSQARSTLNELKENYNLQEKTINDYGKKLFYLEKEPESIYNLEGAPKMSIVSDTHLGSTAEQLENLEHAYDIIKDRDVDLILHAGDISDGCDIYRGHPKHKKAEASGWWRLIDYVLENYPESEIPTHFIDGNHDRALFNKIGKHFGEELSKERDDLIFLGDSYAELYLEDLDLDIQLVHPSGGVPYTLGYRGQTWLRDKPDESKADLTIFGHLHKLLNAKTEGSEILYAGAFQGETDYLERKGIKPQSGFWIVEFEKNEGISSFKTERIEFPMEETEKKIISLDRVPGKDEETD